MGATRGRYKYTSGWCRTHKEFVADDFGAYDVECPVCGGKDNHCATRRGLCCSCYCSLANKVGAAALAEMPLAELVRQGTAAALAALEKGTYTVEARNAKAVEAFARLHGLELDAPPPKTPDAKREQNHRYYERHHDEILERKREAWARRG